MLILHYPIKQYQTVIHETIVTNISSKKVDIIKKKYKLKKNDKNEIIDNEI